MPPKTPPTPVSPPEAIESKRENEDKVANPPVPVIPSSTSGSPPPPIDGLTATEQKEITNKITEKQKKIADLKKEKKNLGAQLRALNSAGAAGGLGAAIKGVMSKINGKTTEIRKLDSEINVLKLKLKQEAHTGSGEEAPPPKAKERKCINGQWVDV